MSWIKKIFPAKAAGAGKKGVPEGLWAKCPNCAAVLYTAELNRNLDVCLKCDHHLRLDAKKRLDIFLDASPRELLAQQVEPKDFLKFKDSKKYKDRLTAAQKSTGLKDAILVMKGQIHEIPVIAAALDFAFIGGSMGAAVGESFVQAVNAAIETRSPFVCFATSGGARMQEALVSLLQMAKTSAALARLASFKLPFISVLCDPTMGGVTASFAMLGDVIISEPNALIGFAGPRVIEQTVRQTLPEGFQRSEFLLAHGAIDLIVNRLEMKKTIAEILAMLTHRKLSVEELSDEN